jgi:hypothetical protein
LTVAGSNFMSGSTVLWNGIAQATTFVSGTQLTASIPGGRLATSGNAAVTVSQPDGTASTNALAFTITNPVPTVNSIVPSTMTHGHSQFTLTVNGSMFLPGAAVLWNGSALTTTFVTTTQLTATVPAASVATIGAATVTIEQPDGTMSTASATFTAN